MTKKVVLITGSSSGIGKASAKYLALKGYTVYASMRNTIGNNAKIKEQAVAWGLSQKVKLHPIELDVTQQSSIQKAVQTIMDREGQIDVVVNDAAYGAIGITEAFSEAEVLAMFNVNLLGAFRVNQAVLPIMRSQKEGLIIHISAGVGQIGVPFMSAYVSSKFALEGFVESLYPEVYSLGIEPIIIQPGHFPTSFMQNMRRIEDEQINAGYEHIAKVPQLMYQRNVANLQEENGPSPDLVAEQIEQLIDHPKGKRPFRTVVDPDEGKFIKSINQSIIAIRQQMREEV